jgi:hypothetical protein
MLRLVLAGRTADIDIAIASVRLLVLRQNAIRVLGLDAA